MQIHLRVILLHCSHFSFRCGFNNPSVDIQPLFPVVLPDLCARSRITEFSQKKKSLICKLFTPGNESISYPSVKARHGTISA